MNTVNNKRKQDTLQKIQSAFLTLAAARVDANSITVSDVCKKADINRTTFYSHYLSMEDLVDDIGRLMRDEFLEVFHTERDTLTHSMDFTKLFANIQENQLFYKLYFKLGFDFSREFIDNDPSNIASKYYPNPDKLEYHIIFFSAGITAIIKKWLAEGCPGTPEEMAGIIGEEYLKKNTFDTDS